MKRFRKRYVLLSFSSPLTPLQMASQEVNGALRSQGIRAWLIHNEPGFLIYRCPHASIERFKGLFPMILPNNESIVVERISGTIRALKRSCLSLAASEAQPSRGPTPRSERSRKDLSHPPGVC
jgi:hypothetical protein